MSKIEHRSNCQLIDRSLEGYGLCTCDFDERMELSIVVDRSFIFTADEQKRREQHNSSKGSRK